MKRLLALTLLIVHLFNLVGYTYLFRYLGQQSTLEISRLIDHHEYNDSELIEIKVALNLPYVNSSNQYERHDGEITLNGKHHNYVKRRISGDTLYLLCLPNKEKDQLQVAARTFGSDANDLDGAGKKELAIKKANTFNQFHSIFSELLIGSAPLQSVTKFPASANTLIDSYIAFTGRPPRTNS